MWQLNILFKQKQNIYFAWSGPAGAHYFSVRRIMINIIVWHIWSFAFFWNIDMSNSWRVAGMFQICLHFRNSVNERDVKSESLSWWIRLLAPDDSYKSGIACCFCPAIFFFRERIPESAPSYAVCKNKELTIIWANKTNIQLSPFIRLIITFDRCNYLFIVLSLGRASADCAQ